MIVVIIAGGSGSRLWPLSTPDYPKHLLTINNGDRSLIQATYDRARKLSDQIYVVTDASHAHHIREQLSDLPADNCIVEPARRGTANCIVNALAHLTTKTDENEPIAFLHADHFIRDVNGFVHSFKVASEASKRAGRIVLVGVEPDHPATGFGYIQKDGMFDEATFVFNVHSFKEKPDYDLAQEYYRSGDYLWNAGYFIGSLATFKESFQKHAPGMLENYQKMIAADTPEARQETYLSFESDAIDYALMERADDLLVVPAHFDWMDLGSFSDLHKAVGGDEKNNHTMGNKVELEDVENSFVQNHEDKPVAVIGLDNVVVVNTPNGILVVRKDQAQKVGDISKRFKS